MLQRPARSADILKPFDRPGVDGLSFPRSGERGQPFSPVDFRDFTNMAGDHGPDRSVG